MVHLQGMPCPKRLPPDNRPPYTGTADHHEGYHGSARMRYSIKADGGKGALKRRPRWLAAIPTHRRATPFVYGSGALFLLRLYLVNEMDEFGKRSL